MVTPIFISYQNYFGTKSSYFVDFNTLQSDFPLHRHSFIELELIVGGMGKNIINGFPYNLSEGSLSMTLPWHVHELIINKENPLQIHKCNFDVEFLINKDTPLGELNDILTQSIHLPPVTKLDEKSFQKVRRLFTDLQEEYRDTRQWKDTLFAVKIAEILIYFDRNRKNLSQNKIQENAEIDNFNIWKVIEYIHASFNQEISIHAVADKFHYSENHLNKLLKDNVGLNFYDLLQEIRVRNASTLLMSSIISIQDVANMVGFHSRDGLYRAFEKVKGISPEKYRKTVLESVQRLNYQNTYPILYAQIIYYLHLHYKEDITLADLAQAFHYNRTYFCKILLENGKNFTDMLQEIRIYHACTQLLTTDNMVNEIGFNVGFSSVKTFYRTFKKIKGITPGKFRLENMAV